MKRQTVQIVLALACLYALVACTTSCGGPLAEATTAKDPNRFYRVAEATIGGLANGGYEPRAVILRDRETGIEYLYIWAGGGNGGGAITRLWEEES